MLKVGETGCGVYRNSVIQLSLFYKSKTSKKLNLFLQGNAMAFLYSFFCPSLRNLDVMAGAQAAILGHEEEGHDAGRLKGAWNLVKFVEIPHQFWNSPSVCFYAKEHNIVRFSHLSLMICLFLLSYLVEPRPDGNVSYLFKWPQTSTGLPPGSFPTHLPPCVLPSSPVKCLVAAGPRIHGPPAEWEETDSFRSNSLKHSRTASMAFGTFPLGADSRQASRSSRARVGVRGCALAREAAVARGARG